MTRIRTRWLTLLASTGLALVASQPGRAQPVDSTWLREHYRKVEARIPMRDGVHLFTSIYVPRDTAVRSFPILMTRTPFSAGPYGALAYRRTLGPSGNPRFARDGYIFVVQDVRGSWMSEGQLVMMTPHREGKAASDVDESTDASDTIAWLLTHVTPNNGRVGLYGISWPGFYTTASCIDAPAAVVACSPQAPITDIWLGDDAFHNGAMMLAANFALSGLGRPRGAQPGREDYRAIDLGPDAYAAFLRMGPIGPAARRLINPDSGWLFYDQAAHLTYDAHARSRDISRHAGGIRAPTLVVGGWFDAEDLQGPFRAWRAIRRDAPATDAKLVVGPWDHGGWSRSVDANTVGKLQFGSPSGPYYRDSIEFPFFRQHLMGGADAGLARVTAFETGSNTWHRYDTFPPQEAERRSLYLLPGRRLSFSAPSAATASPGYDAYVSDPAHPVPLVDRIDTEGAPSDWVVGDQRFASRRPDVLTYMSDVLTSDILIAGPVTPVLHVATTGGDADFIVKLIDVQPDADSSSTLTGAAAGAEILIRGEPFRGRFRRSFERPMPFMPGAPDSIRFEMPDINHRFRRGHRIMVQIQSTWFPLVDRNPQTWVPNILEARPGDFRSARMRVYHTPSRATRLDVFVMP